MFYLHVVYFTYGFTLPLNVERACHVTSCARTAAHRPVSRGWSSRKSRLL